MTAMTVSKSLFCLLLPPLLVTLAAGCDGTAASSADLATAPDARVPDGPSAGDGASDAAHEQDPALDARPIDAAATDETSGAPPAADGAPDAPPAPLKPEEQLAPGMSWIGKDPSAFEAAGNLGSSSWSFTAADINHPSGYYRFNVYQGTPSFGAAPDPTLVKGKPTYTRTELRAGAAQVLKPQIDAWDKAGVLGSKLAPYDERLADARSYPRVPGSKSDGTRCRIERSGQGASSGVPGDETQKTYVYEWQVYIEPGWPGQQLTAAHYQKISVLQVMRNSAFISLYLTDGTSSGAAGNGIFKVQSGPSFTFPLSEQIGKWVYWRLEIRYAKNGTGKIYRGINSKTLTLVDTFNGDTTDGTTSASKESYMKYGIYATKSYAAADKWYQPKAVPPVRTVVWHTGIRFSVVP